MKKIWTLAVCALMATTLTFAQEDDSDGFIEQANEATEEQEESSEQAEEPAEEQESPAKVQANNQADEQPSVQNDAPESALPSEEPNDEYAKQAPRNHESRFGVGIRTAFNYDMMFGFSEENDEIDKDPRGIGFEGGLMLRIQMIPHLYFAPEFNIAYTSTTHKIYEAYDRTYKSLDLEIPLLIRGIVAERFYATAGPQVVLALNSEADIDPIVNSPSGINLPAETHEVVEQTGFTFGIAAGAGFSFIEGLFIDVRFYMGLMELYPDVKTVEDFDDGKYIDPETGKQRDFSIISMKGARMMKLKVGLSYWFI